MFDQILKDPSLLDRLEIFLHPLLNRDPDRVFNLNKTFEAQKTDAAENEDDDAEEMDFDEESWKAEQEWLRKEKLQKYESSMSLIIQEAVHKASVSLSELYGGVLEQDLLSELIPEVGVFKEIMVELLRARRIDITALTQERATYIQEESGDFRLNEMILKVLDGHPDWRKVTALYIDKIPGAGPVVIKNVPDGTGGQRTIRCSDVRIRVSEG